MTETISRIYPSHAPAQAAAGELRKYSLLADYVYVVTASGGPEPGPAATLEALTSAIMKAYVEKRDAQVLAEGVLRGGVLVTVHAPFGAALTAIKILDRFGPIESGLAEPVFDAPAWDEAAPLSSILQIPVALEEPAPLSKFWNVPLLTKGRASVSAALGIPELADHAHSLSGKLGWPLLSDDPAPLSSLLKLKVLKD